MGLLDATLKDPLQYSIVFFVFVILEAVILPVPVELGLINPYVHPALLLGVFALGRGVGSLVVFHIGTRLRGFIKRWSTPGPVATKIVEKSEGLVERYGYYGLLAVMSTPLMIDSLALYLFSMLNPEVREGEGTVMDQRNFTLINVGAALVRGVIVLAAFQYLGLELA